MKQWTIAFQYWNIILCQPGYTQPAYGYIVFEEGELETAIRTLVTEKKNVWVWCSNMREAINYFFTHYIYIKAAGGIVTHALDGRRLLINRNSHWDMAKGKVEPGETLRQAAVREVEEETGLSIAEQGELILKTYHIYDLYGGWHLKQTSWYAMKDSGKTAFKVQEEEGITDAEWCDDATFIDRLKNSYSMMALLCNKVCNL